VKIKLVRPAVFITLIILTVFYSFYAIIAGSIQNKHFAQDNELYLNAKTFAEQLKYPEAAKNVGALVQRYPNSYEILYFYASTQYAQENLDLAQKYFDKAKAQRVFLVNDPSYLAYYGAILSLKGDYPRALKYLQRAKSLNPPPEITGQIDGLLQDISSKIPSKS
jgi:tetratricopeptide (TPR) repeat protein